MVFYLHNCQLLKGLDDREDIFPIIILSILEITKEKMVVLACTTDKFIALPHCLRSNSILKIASYLKKKKVVNCLKNIIFFFFMIFLRFPLNIKQCLLFSGARYLITVYPSCFIMQFIFHVFHLLAVK